MENKTREEGYYWVKNKYEEWKIAHWGDHYCLGLSWALPLNEITHCNTDFDEIDENRIERNTEVLKQWNAAIKVKQDTMQDFENRIVRQEPKTGFIETFSGLHGETIKVNR